MTFKPMLAADADLARITYPVLVSPKIDGFRATMINGELRTRSLKPLRNRELNVIYRRHVRLDGELVAGDPTAKNCFQQTSMAVTAFDAPVHHVKYYVFDIVGADEFAERIADVHRVLKEWGDPRYVPVEHEWAYNEEMLFEREQHFLTLGYEGLMIRDPNGAYKYGRSTVSEGGLLKLKRFLDSEAEIIGYEEQMHNANEATTNALGYTERSSHQANKRPMDVLGALVVRDLRTGVEFNIGTGFTHQERIDYWQTQDLLKGKLVKYRYLPVGVKDKPRHPTFLGFRDRTDL